MQPICPEFCPYLPVHAGSGKSTAYQESLITNDFVRDEIRFGTAENRDVDGSSSLGLERQYRQGACVNAPRSD
jgi:hypothetical protein